VSREDFAASAASAAFVVVLLFLLGVLTGCCIGYAVAIADAVPGVLP
jgi:hypothetical protein